VDRNDRRSAHPKTSAVSARRYSFLRPNRSRARQQAVCALSRPPNRLLTCAAPLQLPIRNPNFNIDPIPPSNDLEESPWRPPIKTIRPSCLGVFVVNSVFRPLPFLNFSSFSSLLSAAGHYWLRSSLIATTTNGGFLLEKWGRPGGCPGIVHNVSVFI
jgi:hypothetical protein